MELQCELRYRASEDPAWALVSAAGAAGPGWVSEQELGPFPPLRALPGFLPAFCTPGSSRYGAEPPAPSQAWAPGEGCSSSIFPTVLSQQPLACKEPVPLGLCAEAATSHHTCVTPLPSAALCRGGTRPNPCCSAHAGPSPVPRWDRAASPRAGLQDRTLVLSPARAGPTVSLLGRERWQREQRGACMGGGRQSAPSNALCSTHTGAGPCSRQEPAQPSLRLPPGHRHRRPGWHHAALRLPLRHAVPLPDAVPAELGTGLLERVEPGQELHHPRERWVRRHPGGPLCPAKRHSGGGMATLTLLLQPPRGSWMRGGALGRPGRAGGWRCSCAGR